MVDFANGCTLKYSFPCLVNNLLCIQMQWNIKRKLFLLPSFLSSFLDSLCALFSVTVKLLPLSMVNLCQQFTIHSLFPLHFNCYLPSFFLRCGLFAHIKNMIVKQPFGNLNASNIITLYMMSLSSFAYLLHEENKSVKTMTKNVVDFANLTLSLSLSC